MFGKRLRKPIKKHFPTSSRSSKAIGDWAEQLACDWLIERGLKLVEQNFRTRYGEIDLIMQDGNCLVFVEVRYRKNSIYGSAEDSITAKKCQRLAATAEKYLLTKGFNNNTAIRFDALAISPAKESDLHCTINWIKNILL